MSIEQENSESVPQKENVLDLLGLKAWLILQAVIPLSQLSAGIIVNAEYALMWQG